MIEKTFYFRKQHEQEILHGQSEKDLRPVSLLLIMNKM